MKTLCVLILSLFAITAAAEKPVIPENIKFADVCMYHTYRGFLTCEDGGGNVLFKKVRLFREFRWLAYPALPVISAMKRLGFDALKTKQSGDDVQISFARPVTCR